MTTQPLPAAETNLDGGVPVEGGRDLVGMAFEMLGRVVEAGLHAAGAALHPDGPDAHEAAPAKTLTSAELRELGQFAAVAAAVGLTIAGGRKAINMASDAIARRRAN